ncbi:hypothetical protein [Dictyobacter arantiisoli]|uniref:KOW domain-containing protein n=1 Tax=Dictyobacter arantiisoli TaxID=2014874 RepID=A0A5A5TEL7_9CHLR|nr:hypothetical protein [Dictyobacter arantiisoli]GCF09354.1 hypothetical protein KDI_29180 [Dictyobacter arantiisoli]
MTYASGWPVIPRQLLKRERWPGGYQVKGIPLVYHGQEVVPDQPVLRLASLQHFKEEEKRLLAHSSSPILPAAAVASFPPQNIPAGLHGRVVGFTARGGVVIESHAAFLQGVLGAGNQVAGILTIWQAPDRYNTTRAIPPGAILVVPGPLTLRLLHQALASGVVGVIASSIALRDLEGFLRADYLQLLKTSNPELAQSQLPPLTILLTEGIGSVIMPPRTLNLLHHYQGSIGLLSGITLLSHHIYPELVISIPLVEIEKGWRAMIPDTTLALGSLVRVAAGECLGLVGRIDYFFVYEQTFASNLRARAVRLRAVDGSFYVIPLANIERIG